MGVVFNDVHYYELLGLQIDADQVLVDAAFRALSKKYHPDNNPSPEANEQMQKINVAYTILRNPKTRAEYNVWLKLQHSSSNKAGSANSAHNAGNKNAGGNAHNTGNSSAGDSARNSNSQKSENSTNKSNSTEEKKFAHLREYPDVRAHFEQAEKLMGIGDWEDAAVRLRKVLDNLLKKLLDKYVDKEDIYKRVSKGAGDYLNILFSAGIIDQSDSNSMFEFLGFLNTSAHGSGDITYNAENVKDAFNKTLKYSKVLVEVYIKSSSFNDWDKYAEDRWYVNQVIQDRENGEKNTKYNRNPRYGSYEHNNTNEQTSSSSQEQKNDRSSKKHFWIPYAFAACVCMAMVFVVLLLNGQGSFGVSAEGYKSFTRSMSRNNNSSATVSIAETEPETEGNLPEYEIAVDGTNVRAEANKESDKLGKLDLGETIIGTGKISKDKKWVEVCYPDDQSTGWVRLSHLKSESDKNAGDESDEHENYIVTAENTLNIRESSNSDSPAIYKLKNGQIVTGTGKPSENEKWIEVYLPDNSGTTGWVYSEYIEKL